MAKKIKAADKRLANARAGVRKYSKLIPGGSILAIDPSVGSSSSMPGWAVLREGETLESGVIKLKVSQTLQVRLSNLAAEVGKLVDKFNPDVVVVEDIPPRHYGRGGNAIAHASLLKATGAILSVVGLRNVIQIHPQVWHRYLGEADATYVKSDDGDAIVLGQTVYKLYSEMEEL